MQKSKTSKILSLLLAAIMVVGMLPMTALSAFAATTYLTSAGVKDVKLPAVGEREKSETSLVDKDKYTWKNLSYSNSDFWIETSEPVTDIKSVGKLQSDGTYSFEKAIFSGTYKEGMYYTLLVCLEAKTSSGYYWATDKSTIAATINGSPANVTDAVTGTSASMRNTIGIWKCYGPMTYDPATTNCLNRVEINDVKIPVIGEKNSNNRSLPQSANYKTGDISFNYVTTNYHPVYHFMWLESDEPVTDLKYYSVPSMIGWKGSVVKPEIVYGPAYHSSQAFNGTFKEGKYYTCLINITPTGDTTWAPAEYVNATINGQPANVASGNYKSSLRYFNEGQGLYTVWKCFGPLKSINVFEANATAPKYDAAVDFTAKLPDDCGYTCDSVLWFESNTVPTDTRNAFELMANGEARLVQQGEKFKTNRNYTAVAYLTPKSSEGYCIPKGVTPTGLLSGYPTMADTTIYPGKVLISHTFTNISYMAAKWDGNKATWNTSAEASRMKLELFKDNKFAGMKYVDYADGQVDLTADLTYFGAGDYYFRATIQRKYTNGSYGDLATDQSETVYKNLSAPVAVEMTTPPEKFTYATGEDFDQTGMVITATYKDGSKKAVTGYTLSNTGNLQPGSEITVTYTENGATVSVSITPDVQNVTAFVNTVVVNNVTKPVALLLADYDFAVGDTCGVANGQHVSGIKKFTSGASGKWIETNTEPTAYSDLEKGVAVTSTSRFKEGKYYTFVAEICNDSGLNSGYKFASDFTAKLNGKPANVKKSIGTDTPNIVWYCFGKAPLTISHAYIDEVRVPVAGETASFDYITTSPDYIPDCTNAGWVETDSPVVDYVSDPWSGEYYSAEDTLIFKADKYYTFIAPIIAADGKSNFVNGIMNTHDAFLYNHNGTGTADIYYCFGKPLPENASTELQIGGVNMKVGYYLPGGNNPTSADLTTEKPLYGGYAYMADADRLVLDNFTIDMADSSSVDAAIKNSMKDLRIDIRGENTVYGDIYGILNTPDASVDSTFKVVGSNKKEDILNLGAEYACSFNGEKTDNVLFSTCTINITDMGFYNDTENSKLEFYNCDYNCVDTNGSIHAYSLLLRESSVDIVNTDGGIINAHDLKLDNSKLHVKNTQYGGALIKLSSSQFDIEYNSTLIAEQFKIGDEAFNEIPEMYFYDKGYTIVAGASAETATLIDVIDTTGYRYVRIMPNSDLKLGGVNMTEGYFLPSGTNRTEADLTDVQPTSGGFAYMSDNKTLILSNYKFEGKNGTIAKAIENKIDGLEIHVAGENVIKGKTYGIHSENADISIIGTDTASSKIALGGGSYSLNADKGVALFRDCSVTGDGIIKAKDISFYYSDIISYGVRADKVIIGGCKAVKFDDTDCGIIAKLVDIADSIVEVSGHYEEAINAQNIYISGSTVEAYTDSNDGQTHTFTCKPHLEEYGIPYTTIYAGDSESTAVEVSEDTDYHLYKYVRIQSEDMVASEYTIDVSSGTAKDTLGNTILKAAPGTLVVVTADAPASGKVFNEWQGDAKSLNMGNINSSSTTFIMPEKNVSLWASYKEGSSFLGEWTMPGLDEIWKNKTVGDYKTVKIPADAQYTIGEVNWVIFNKILADNEKFSDGDTFGLNIEIIPNPGYTLPSGFTATLNGMEPDFRVVNAGVTKLVFLITVTTPDEYRTKNISLQVNGLTKGKKLSEVTASCLEGYVNIDGITVLNSAGDPITDANATFIPGTTYKVKCEVTPEYAWYDMENRTAKVNGQNAEFSVVLSGTGPKKTFVDYYVTYTFTVSDVLPTEYSINVTNGTSSPAKAIKGATVTITANAAPSGKVFDKWVVKAGGVTLAKPNNATTTFTMGEQNVTVEATYKALPPTEHSINVTSGTASPSKAVKGATVTVTAYAAPSGKVFDKWVVKAGGVTLANPNSATTTFTMGEQNVTVEATYKAKAPEIAYGDIDGNGIIQAADARLCLRASVGLEVYAANSVQALACDVDGNGTIQAADARLILRKSVGLETSFPAEKK